MFQLGCIYSSQILSYQKMLGQLHDAGNTTTLAHYLELLSGAGVLTGIHKYANKKIRSRISSPKLQVFNTALMSAQTEKTFQEAKKDKEYWGRLVESAVGAYLLNEARGKQIEIYYWREKNLEVDFIIKKADSLTAIEVKSSNKKEKLSGMDAFVKAYQPNRILWIGAQGISLEDFFKIPIEHLIEK